MGSEPGLRNVYPPAFHTVVAALGSVVSHPLAIEGVTLASVALLLFGVRRLQRATGLPESSAALYALAPYGFALSYCLPKIEAAGYGVALFGLAFLLEGRLRAAAAALATCFWVHTGAALFFGLAGGVLALARRDRAALLALAMGSLGALPLVGMHLAAGCSLAEALLFSAGDYLRSADGWSSLDDLPRLVALAGPVAAAVACLGARGLWQRHRDAAVLSITILILCTNELWLAPFEARTTLNLLRGLTLLAIPIAFAAGVALESRPRWGIAAWIAIVLSTAAAARFALPGSCHREAFAWERVADTRVDRCTFRWAVRSPR